MTVLKMKVFFPHQIYLHDQGSNHFPHSFLFFYFLSFFWRVLFLILVFDVFCLLACCYIWICILNFLKWLLRFTFWCQPLRCFRKRGIFFPFWFSWADFWYVPSLFWRTTTFLELTIPHVVPVPIACALISGNILASLTVYHFYIFLPFWKVLLALLKERWADTKCFLSNVI